MINTTHVTNANELFNRINEIGNAVMWLLIALAVVYIVWNIFLFIKNAGGDKRKEYQLGIAWGIVGLAIILCIWGLVNILENTFGVGNSQNSSNYNSAVDVNSLMLKPPTSNSPANTPVP